MTTMPLATPIDWSEFYLAASMLTGLVISILLLLDALRDNAVASKLPYKDLRRPLAQGLLALSIGYLILKLVFFYFTISLVFDLQNRGAIVRLAPAFAVNVMDLCAGIFWYLRRRAL